MDTEKAITLGNLRVFKKEQSDETEKKISGISASDIGALTNIKIGTVTTGAAGSSAAASASTNGTVTTLNLTIPKGDKGATGDTGDTGSAGTGGSRISVGTAITGTATSNTAFTGSGITDALVNDMYLNSSTWNMYRCTVAGNATNARWVYVGNIKGATGAAGTNATTTAVAGTSSNGLMSSSDKTKLDGIDMSTKMDKANPTGTGALSLNRVPDSTVGAYSVAMGYKTEASDYAATAFGQNTVASGNWGSFAVGGFTTASGSGSFATGYGTTASGSYSHAGGYGTKTGCNYDFVTGKYNSPNSSSLLTIGYGSSSSELKNVFRVSAEGTVYAAKEFKTSGADYAEYIKPWWDDNPDGEDRHGYFVTIKDGKLRFAEPGDYIVGITSGNPSVVGNGDEDWLGRWQRDEFDTILYHDVEVDDYEMQIGEDGEPVEVKVGTHTEKQTIPNPDYDSTLPYIERKDRPEWDCVGMIGVLPLRDDGTCEPGGFAKCSSGGIATKSDEWECHRTFFVIERVNDHIVRVEMR